MRAALLVFTFAVFQNASAFPDVGKATCTIKGRTFELDVGRAKVPTYAAVILPDGKLLRLRYSPEEIDTLGPQYSKGRISIRLNDLVGVDSMSRRVTVFRTPGVYQFTMQDANTAEGMELHRLQCSVTLTKAQLSFTGIR